MPLKNLNALAIEAQNKCSEYGKQETELSEDFKECFSNLLSKTSSDKIVYKKYTAVVTSANNLTITFPNQWFFIASFFTDYLKALFEYKNIFNKISETTPNLKSSVPNLKNGEQMPAEIIAKIEAYFPDIPDRENFKKFLTDYSWWYGSKTIDRTDYFVSPVLNLAKVINNSQSYIAHLADVFSQDNKLSELLNKSLTVQETENINHISDPTIKNFIFKVFKFLDERNKLPDLLKYKVVNGVSEKYQSIKYKELSLTSIFWVFNHQAREAELIHKQKEGGKLRAFPELLFSDDEKYYYLSGEWTDNGRSRLDFQTFRTIFNDVFQGEFSIRKNNGVYELIILSLQKHPLNQILYGPPGTGKTYNTINHALAIINGKDVSNYINEQKANPSIREVNKDEFDYYVLEGQIQFVTFHQSYSYEEFIEGIKIKLNEDNEVYYEIENGIFKKLCVIAGENENKNYVLIIDEINRGNISKIFGELITLIEDSKRLDRKEEIEIKLTYSGSDENEPLFGVPENLYIIGTMNTADKSIALIDSALRRRFTFIEYTADSSYLSDNVEGINLKELLDKMNNRIEYLLDRDHLLGHAYLIDVKSKNELCDVFRNKIIPLLEEYFYNDFGKIRFVLGDNDGWKKPEDLQIIKVTKHSKQKEIFGTEIDGLEKELFSINSNLANRKYDEIPIGFFKSIYEKDFVEQPTPPEAVSVEVKEPDEDTDISDS